MCSKLGEDVEGDSWQCVFCCNNFKNVSVYHVFRSHGTHTHIIPMSGGRGSAGCTAGGCVCLQGEGLDTPAVGPGTLCPSTQLFSRLLSRPGSPHLGPGPLRRAVHTQVLVHTTVLTLRRVPVLLPLRPWQARPGCVDRGRAGLGVPGQWGAGPFSATMEQKENGSHPGWAKLSWPGGRCGDRKPTGRRCSPRPVRKIESPSQPHHVPARVSSHHLPTWGDPEPSCHRQDVDSGRAGVTSSLVWATDLFGHPCLWPLVEPARPWVHSAEGECWAVPLPPTTHRGPCSARQ